MLNYAEECFPLGRTDEALTHGHAAVRLFRQAGNRTGECRALNAVGYLYAVRGDYGQAIASCSEALARQRRLGETRAAMTDPVGAARAWRRAARIYDDLAHPAADDVRRRLARAGAPQA